MHTCGVGSDIIGGQTGRRPQVGALPPIDHADSIPTLHRCIHHVALARRAAWHPRVRPSTGHEEGWNSP
ncbi:hypothetical protein ABTQ05_20000, partial [Acinetobacter baumannii]